MIGFYALLRLESRGTNVTCTYTKPRPKSGARYRRQLKPTGIAVDPPAVYRTDELGQYVYDDSGNPIIDPWPSAARVTEVLRVGGKVLEKRTSDLYVLPHAFANKSFPAFEKRNGMAATISYTIEWWGLSTNPDGSAVTNDQGQPLYNDQLGTASAPADSYAIYNTYKEAPGPVPPEWSSPWKSC